MTEINVDFIQMRKHFERKTRIYFFKKIRPKFLLRKFAHVYEAHAKCLVQSESQFPIF